MHAAAKATITAFVSFTLVACAGGQKTAVLVSPEQLPYLGRTTAPEFDGIPVVETIDGQSHEFKGPIESVELNTRKRPVPVDVPFSARIEGDKLEVSTDQVRTYRLLDVPYVKVEYNHEKRNKRDASQVSPARRNIGLALGLGSILPLSLGVVVLASDPVCTGGGGISACNLATSVQSVFGAALLISGAGMLVAGIVVGVSSSSPSTPRKTTTIQPQLRIGPAHGTLSFDF